MITTWRFFLKKLFRLLIAVFCILFALYSIPFGFRPVLQSFFHDLTGIFSEQTDESSPALPPEEKDQEPGSLQEPEPISAPDVTGSEYNQATDGTDSTYALDESGQAEDFAGGGENVSPDGSSSGGPQYNDGGSPADGSVENGEAVPADGAGEFDGGGYEDGGVIPEEAQNYVRGPVADEDIIYYYYTCISPEERLLYDAMLALAQNPYNDGSYEESRLVSIDPSSEDFSVSYTRAFNALINDHPELFWVSMSRAVYQCRYYVMPAFGGQYKVIFSLVFPDAGEEGSGYSGADLRSIYTEEQNQLRAASDAILQQVDFTQSDPLIALQIHDLLLGCAWYNRGAGFDDYAHTAYGALVADSSGNPGGALCDGYSLAYVYLLQRAGLTAAMVCGNAGPSEDDLEKHAWNIVCLDNEWYEVDATWDDLDFEISPSDEGYNLLMEALSDEVYMARIRHYMFNRTTAETRYFEPGEEYRYSSDNGWVSLLQPSVHIRFSEEEAGTSRDYITPLAPEATGTFYTWEMLVGL